MTELDIAQTNARSMWDVDNLELLTVGIDIGSATSHLMIARIGLRRMGMSLSSRFVVVNRDVVFSSDVLLTPYLDDYTIDAEVLYAFVTESYLRAGLAVPEVQTGAVLLTGEAAKRHNAPAIAYRLADVSGDFVCAAAGPGMEAQLAAAGSGTVAASRRARTVLLNIDIGGGTTKFSVVRDGTIEQTAALSIGGRLLAHDSAGRITRLEPAAAQLAAHLGLSLATGSAIDAEQVAAIADVGASYIEAAVLGAGVPNEAATLWITDPYVAPEAIDGVVFSGGVSSYLVDAAVPPCGDLGMALAQSLQKRIATRVPVIEAVQTIRATVVGLSQFSVQVSGNTIYVHRDALPQRNLRVIKPSPIAESADLDADLIAADIVRAAADDGLATAEVDGDGIAIAIEWAGMPFYPRVRAVADALAAAGRELISTRTGAALVVMCTVDIANTIGRILVEELTWPGSVVCVDGIELEAFDYVDLGEVNAKSGVVPVVIKSLLFPASD